MRGVMNTRDTASDSLERLARTVLPRFPVTYEPRSRHVIAVARRRSAAPRRQLRATSAYRPHVGSTARALPQAIARWWPAMIALCPGGSTATQTGRAFLRREENVSSRPRRSNVARWCHWGAGCTPARFRIDRHPICNRSICAASAAVETREELFRAMLEKGAADRGRAWRDFSGYRQHQRHRRARDYRRERLDAGLPQVTPALSCSPNRAAEQPAGQMLLRGGGGGREDAAGKVNGLRAYVAGAAPEDSAAGKLNEKRSGSFCLHIMAIGSWKEI